MADLISAPQTEGAALPGSRGAAAMESGAALRYDLIELLFFAYRDFVGQADAVLADYEFGRAHHRMLHFVARNPGMTVADLLDILRITKQSLGRVLKQLVDEGFIVQRAGPRDRRQRLLYPTPKGEALARRLSELQSERIGAALAACPPGSDEAVRRFLLAMIAAGDRADVARITGLEALAGHTGAGE